MAKVRCKGTSLKQEISSVYTAVAQMLSYDLSGSEGQYYDSSTLDGGIARTYNSTGYAETPEASFELFYDPALSGHQSFTDLIEADTAPTASPPLVPCNFRITYGDTASTTQTHATVGHKADVAVAMDDGLKMTAGYKVTGTAGWPT